MTVGRSRAFLTLAAATLLGLLLGGFALSRSGYRAEAQLLDRFIPLRYQLFGAEQVDPRLLLVGVDGATLDRLGKPLIFWQADLAALLERIKEGQPAAVGLDLLISPKTSGLDADDPVKKRLQDEAMKLGMAAMSGPPVVMVERYAQDEYSLEDSNQNQLVSPHEIVRGLLTHEDGTVPAFGIGNIATDPDGAVRRLKLFHWKHPKTGQSRPANFALRLLEHATGKAIQFDERTGALNWNGVSVPFLFDETFLMNYPGPIEENVAPGEPPLATLSYPVLPAGEVLDGKVPPVTFKDKIVIVAPVADALDDTQIVPGDATYPGGALHATVLNMFLTDSFVSRPPLVWLLTTTLSALLGCLIGRTGRLGLLVGLLLLLPLTEFLLFAQARLWLPAFFSLVAYVGGSLLGYVERLTTVERDRAVVRSTFARMVSPQVMRHVLKEMAHLRHGVRKEVTVLFTDINGFTPICEKHEPEELIEMLSDYFSLMVDVIMKYDGYLKQYVGDEIMVIFGAPDDRDDHATRAVLTALEMREVLAQAKARANGAPGFYDIKAGINTGSVVVGRVGPEARWEYAAVGDNVNLGARVMSAAQKLGLDIAVSEATRLRYQHERAARAEAGPDPVEWTSLGVQTFKGKVSQMEVHAVAKNPPSPPQTGS